MTCTGRQKTGVVLNFFVVIVFIGIFSVVVNIFSLFVRENSNKVEWDYIRY